MLVAALWTAVHHVPWLGPALHDIGRAVFGTTAMGWFEQLAYSVDAGWHKLWGIDERSEAIWNTPAPSASGATGQAPPGVRPKDLSPLVMTSFSKGDGAWFPLIDPRTPGDAPHAFRTILHADSDAAGVVMRVVAIDLQRAELHLAAENSEPPNDAARAIAVLRASPGSRPVYGLAVAGRTIRAPAKSACVVAAGSSGTLTFGFWSDHSPEAVRSWTWWRQAPPCLLDRGESLPGLSEADRGRVDRVRGLIGLGRDGQLLYLAVAEQTSDAAAARAMKHAGAWSVAQLEGQGSDAELVVYDGSTSDRGLVGRSLRTGAQEPLGAYFSAASNRDFFYVSSRGK